MSNAKRLKFGIKGHKYLALSLLLAKWMRRYASSKSYCYVTLGGTELSDAMIVSWIDTGLATNVLSYEQDPDRYKLAVDMRQQLSSKGIEIEVIKEDIFSYRRHVEAPHIFYLDLLGTCKLDPYKRLFKTWFEADVIQPNDLILITSCVGRKPGWERVLSPFDSEFRLLRTDSMDMKKRLYDAAHPFLVLRRALTEAGLHEELNLRFVGSVKYRDSMVMGLYGVVCEELASSPPDLGSAMSEVSFFNAMKRDWESLSTSSPASN